MAFQTTGSLFNRLIPPLVSLREDALQLEDRLADELAQVEPAYQNSARNFIHYLSVRQKDIRNLQRDLAALGLSSLGVLEANAMASLNAVIGVLGRLTQQDMKPAPDPPADFRTGPLLLQDHTRSLLGPQPYNRSVRIMVTMPDAAANDPQLLRGLLTAGMDVMRINCAHDDPDTWAAMVNNLRKAEKAVGRICKIQADLAGPKLRTGQIKPVGRVVKLGPKRDFMGRVVTAGKVWVTSESNPQLAPSDLDKVLSVDQELLNVAEEGDIVKIRDARDERRDLILVSQKGGSFLAETTQAIYIVEGATIRLFRKNECIAVGRIGSLPEIVLPIVLCPDDTLILTRADNPGIDALRDATGEIIEPARIHCTLDEAFEQVKPGERVWFDDGKIGGLVKANDGQYIVIEITHTGLSGAKLRAEKVKWLVKKTKFFLC